MKRKSLYPAISAEFGGNGKLRLLLIALLCAGLVFGCAQIRKVTYPRDFVYLEHKERRNKMALLLFYLGQLDETMLKHSIADSDPQQDILALLNKIDDLTLELGAGVSIRPRDIDDQFADLNSDELAVYPRTNHLVIDDHIDEFKIDVQRALDEASASPPNYFRAGRLFGSCTGCHKFRD